MRKKTVLIITLFVFTLLTTSTQAIPINKPFSQRENDSLAINLQQEPYLNDYPISAHYFQGMRSPGFSGDEGWSDYSFYRGTHRGYGFGIHP